jgi:hypothetical protein
VTKAEWDAAILGLPVRANGGAVVVPVSGEVIGVGGFRYEDGELVVDVLVRRTVATITFDGDADGPTD